MKKGFVPLLSTLSITFLFSCRSNICCTPEPPNPGALFFNIKHNGNYYPDSLMAGVQLYYYYNEQKITDPNKSPSRPLNMMYTDSLLLQRVYGYNGYGDSLAPGAFSSVYVLDAVVTADVRRFYLKFADGTVDTFDIDVKNEKEKDIASVPCKCLHQITSITLNGQPLQTDTTKYTMYYSQADNNNYLIQK